MIETLSAGAKTTCVTKNQQCGYTRRLVEFGSLRILVGIR